MYSTIIFFLNLCLFSIMRQRDLCTHSFLKVWGIIISISIHYNLQPSFNVSFRLNQQIFLSVDHSRNRYHSALPRTSHSTKHLKKRLNKPHLDQKEIRHHTISLLCRDASHIMSLGLSFCMCKTRQLKRNVVASSPTLDTPGEL